MSNASTQQASAAFHANMAAKATPRNVFRVSNKPDSGNTNVNFGVKLGTPDVQDEPFYLQQQMTNEQGIVPGVGQAIVGPDYFNYVARKEQVGMYAQFQEWLMNQADFSTPEASEYWYKHHPWMLEKRIDEVERVADLQKQMAKINIGGPQTEEDWKLLFAKEQGLVVVPEQAPHLLGLAEVGGGYIATNYRQGMFSPMITNPPGTVNPPRALNQKVNWSNPIGATTPISPGITYPLSIQNYGRYQPIGPLRPQ